MEQMTAQEARAIADARVLRSTFPRRDGVDVIESYTITGMAHGTPLATKTHGGAAGPFLLEAGISSSLPITSSLPYSDPRWMRCRSVSD